VQGSVALFLNLLRGCSSVTPSRLQSVPRLPAIRSLSRIPPEHQKPVAVPTLICQTCHRPRSRGYCRWHRIDPRSFPQRGNCARTRCIQSRRRLRPHNDRYMMNGGSLSPISQTAVNEGHQYLSPNTSWTNTCYPVFSPDRLSRVLREDTDASAVQIFPPSYDQSQAEYRYRTSLETVYEME